MKTLIVAANADHAKTIRRQIIDREQVVCVTHPGAVLGQRFDMIIVTDYYQRWHHFASDAEQKRNTQWFDEVVRCRLSGPNAPLIQL